MANITQSRNLDPYTAKYKYSWNGAGIANPLGDTASLPRGFQETNSYRSLRGKDLSAPELQQASGSHAALIEELANESARFRSSKYDNGHEFWTEKFETEFTSLQAGTFISADPVLYQNGLRYSGFLTPMRDIPMQYAAIAPVTSTDVNIDGAKFIDSTIPTAPHTSLVQFVAELALQLPKLIGLQLFREQSFRTVGSEHLNIEFGWKPTMSDIQKLAHGTLQANEMLLQYWRDAGRNVRRKRVIERDREFVEQSPSTDGIGMGRFPWGPPYYPADYFFSSPETRIFDTIERTVSFSGCYTYWVEANENFVDHLQSYEEAANYLLGTRLTAETFWELTPWSWLIDWFSDVGAIIANAERFSADDLVMRYAYVMHETRATRTYTKTNVQPLAGGQAFSISAFLTHVKKQRVRASPYGFGINVANLSARRWAILAALGMTSSSGSLRL